MTDTSERLAAAVAAQQKWKAEQISTPPAPPPPSGPKAGFAPARPLLQQLVSQLNSSLSDGLAVTIDDNDLYWPNGGLSVLAKGRGMERRLSAWADEAGTLFIGGNPNTREAGEAVGSVSAPDMDKIESRIVEQIEFASGAKTAPVTAS